MAKKDLSIAKLETHCESVAGLLRALSHPSRLMILGHLTKGAKTVSELQVLTGVSQSQLSQFLTRMKTEGLIECRREGRFQYYSISDGKLVRLIQSLQDIFC